MLRSVDCDTDLFDIVARVVKGATLKTYMLKICLEYVLRTFIELMKENGFTVKKRQQVDNIQQN